MEQPTIQIYCENNAASVYVPEGASLAQILELLELSASSPILSAFVDNHMKELTTRIYSPKSVRFVERTSSDGMRVYTRSLFFLLQKAVRELHPGSKLKVLYTAARGYYFEVYGAGQIGPDQVAAIRERMRELATQDIPIGRNKLMLADAERLYHANGLDDKLTLLGTRPEYFVTVYDLDGLPGYFYGAMVPSTGYLDVFDLQPYGSGMVLLLPRRDEHYDRVEPMKLEPKLFGVFQQNREWSDILNVSDVGTLNSRILEGEASQMIKVGEALQEKTLAGIADEITERHWRGDVKIVFIAGPSSSGKTTLTKRLSIQLRVLGLEPNMISLDDYFVERDRTPLDEHGEYDFEALEAIDIEVFNADLNRLFDGERVELPKFRFTDGKRYYDGTTLQLNERSILLVEGIHGLNPRLTSHIEDHLKYKVYASALTTLALDDLTLISTTDNRMLRRMVRDSKYRGRSAYDTIKGWPSVRRGEDKNIFPHQEQADVMVNTALFFEIPVLKKYAQPLLQQVPANTPQYAEALRLLRFLSYFVDIPDNELPPTSILREFVGGSSFSY